MNEIQILKLQINQLVKVKCKEHEDGFFVAQVKSINDWTKLIGVVDSNGKFKEYPYRLIQEDNMEVNKKEKLLKLVNLLEIKDFLNEQTNTGD